MSVLHSFLWNYYIASRLFWEGKFLQIGLFQFLEDFHELSREHTVVINAFSKHSKGTIFTSGNWFMKLFPLEKTCYKICKILNMKAYCRDSHIQLISLCVAMLSKISGVTVNCSPTNLIIQCTLMWNVSEFIAVSIDKVKT